MFKLVFVEHHETTQGKYVTIKELSECRDLDACQSLFDWYASTPRSPTITFLIVKDD
jgi:hypothetical protein